MISWAKPLSLVSVVLITLTKSKLANGFAPRNIIVRHDIASVGTKATLSTLFAKKSKKNKGAGGGNYKKGGGQPQQEKQSVKDQRFDAVTRQFMFSIVGLSKTLPDKVSISKHCILYRCYLS